MKKKLIALPMFLLALVGCQSNNEKGSLVYHFENNAVTSLEFENAFKEADYSMLFVDITLDALSLSDDYKSAITDDMTAEEIDEIRKEMREEQKEYYSTITSGFITEYDLESICDSLETFSYEPTIELIYLDGEISDEEMDTLYEALNDELTISIDVYSSDSEDEGEMKNAN